MEVVLFNNGQGMTKVESARLVGDRLKLSFNGAPAYSILSIVGDKHTIRTHLSSDNTCEVLINDIINSDVRLVLSAKSKTWYIDGFRIERDKDGSIYMTSLADYTEKLKKCFADIEELRSVVKTLTDNMKKLSADVDRYKKDYQII